MFCPALKQAVVPALKAVHGNCGGQGESGPAYQALLDLSPTLLIPSINDAVSEGKLFQDVAGTIPADAANDPVALVQDFSGNGNDLTQSTATARPLLKHDGTNWYLWADGIDDDLSVTYADSLPNPHAVAGGMQYETAVTNSILWDGISAQRHFCYRPATGKLRIGGGAYFETTDVMAIGQNSVVLAEYNGTSSRGRINTAETIGDGDTKLPTGIRLFATYVGTGRAQGRCYGLAVYPSALAANDKSVVENYLAGNCGVTL